MAQGSWNRLGARVRGFRIWGLKLMGLILWSRSMLNKNIYMYKLYQHGVLVVRFGWLASLLKRCLRADSEGRGGAGELIGLRPKLKLLNRRGLKDVSISCA